MALPAFFLRGIVLLAAFGNWSPPPKNPL